MFLMMEKSPKTSFPELYSDKINYFIFKLMFLPTSKKQQSNYGFIKFLFPVVYVTLSCRKLRDPLFHPSSLVPGFFIPIFVYFV